jgi:molybdopterin molybdotransferase
VGSSLLDPRVAAKAVLERAPQGQAEPVPLTEALGRVLARDVTSADDVPGFDNSAMDGFALRSADVTGASSGESVSLRLVGESRAGHPYEGSLGAGEAIAISTGAMVPPGADTVLRVEDAVQADVELRVAAPVEPGKEIRRAGEDIRAGDTVLAAGTRLGAAELGVAASTGVAELSCTRPPRVAVVVTGDELISPPAPLGPGQIRNTNGYSVPAQAVAAGATVAYTATVGDDYRATVAELERALEADVVVVTGGVSVGPHDHVKPALAELGVDEVFWGVALRPGKPTYFGTFDKPGASARGSAGSVLVFGLPGNPVSAMVTFHLFVRPALARMLGTTPRERHAVASFDADYAKHPGRAHVVRCKLEARDDGWHVEPTKDQGSHVLTSMLGAEAFAYLDVERGDVSAGERVEIEILRAA